MSIKGHSIPIPDAVFTMFFKVLVKGKRACEALVKSSIVGWY